MSHISAHQADTKPVETVHPTTFQRCRREEGEQGRRRACRFLAPVDKSFTKPVFGPIVCGDIACICLADNSSMGNAHFPALSLSGSCGRAATSQNGSRAAVFACGGHDIAPPSACLHL
ncbi:hypothetical protein NUW54_g13218 [Trametes sanguinea]|uniref:Uncharacterized protein n=1 Tax=Trametes sanguinea TaxID=158606 RepID=A0ACC1MN75_9APHY|nr:hypothetical protein NUW54_g13218 [Trametes sanguinea]